MYTPSRTILRVFAALLLAAVATGCNACNDPEVDPPGEDGGTEQDAGVDMQTDMSEPVDMGTDTSADPDVGTDMTTPDAGPDAATDMAPDMNDGELCDNGEDDDGDGNVDCRDDDCDAADACVAVAVGTGTTHACAAFADGRVRCWGDNSQGALGNGTTDAQPQPPVEVDGIDDAVDVVAGEQFSCARHEDQTISCWGLNDTGQLGDASFIDSSLPVKVVGIGDATDVAAGDANACAVSEAEGAVFCWGSDQQGQLGNDTTLEPSNDPVRVEVFAILDVVPLVNAVDVECSMRSCCAVRDDATAVCWGRNAEGQLASGIDNEESGVGLVAAQDVSPFEVLSDVADVGVAANFTCFAKTDNTVWCSGSVPALQRDHPAAPDLPNYAVELDLFADAVEIWGGAAYACSLRTSGRVLCWGANGKGQAGDPSSGFSDGYQLPDLVDPVDLDTGDQFTCTVDSAGHVYCFGDNEFRQLGVDTNEPDTTEAQRVIF